MDNKATIIMASALVAILLTSTVANQAFAQPSLGALKGALGAVKGALGTVRGDLGALFGSSGGGTIQGGGGTGGHH